MSRVQPSAATYQPFKHTRTARKPRFEFEITDAIAHTACLIEQLRIQLRDHCARWQQSLASCTQLLIELTPGPVCIDGSRGRFPYTSATQFDSCCIKDASVHQQVVSLSSKCSGAHPAAPTRNQLSTHLVEKPISHELETVLVCEPWASTKRQVHTQERAGTQQRAANRRRKHPPDPLFRIRSTS